MQTNRSASALRVMPTWLPSQMRHNLVQLPQTSTTHSCCYCYEQNRHRTRCVKSFPPCGLTICADRHDTSFPIAGAQRGHCCVAQTRCFLPRHQRTAHAKRHYCVRHLCHELLSSCPEGKTTQTICYTTYCASRQPSCGAEKCARHCGQNCVARCASYERLCPATIHAHPRRKRAGEVARTAYRQN